MKFDPIVQGIQTVSQLCAMTVDDLEKIPKLNTFDIKSIQRRLGFYGLSLKGEPRGPDESVPADLSDSIPGEVSDELTGRIESLFHSDEV